MPSNPQVQLGWDNAALTRGADEAARKVSAFEKKANASLGGIRKLDVSGLTGPLAAALSVGAISSLAKDAVTAAGNLEGLVNGLTAVSSEGEDVQATLARLAKVAAQPGLGFAEAIQGAVNLRAVGFSAKQAEDILTQFGNALATVGKGKDDLAGVVLALSQIISKGKVSAEEINQIAERVPQIRKVMKDAFGTADTEAIQKMGIAVEDFVGRVVAELAKIPRVAGGLRNELENTSDQIDQLTAKLGKELAPAYVGALNGAIEVVTELGIALDSLRGRQVEPGLGKIFDEKLIEGNAEAARRIIQAKLQEIRDYFKDLEQSNPITVAIDVGSGKAQAMRELYDEYKRQLQVVDELAKAKKQEAEINQVIAKTDADEAAALKKLNDERERAMKLVLEKVVRTGKRDEERDETRRAGYNDEEKLVEALAKREALEKAIKKAREVGDETTALDREIEIEKVKREILSLEERIAEASQRSAEEAERDRNAAKDKADEKAREATSQAEALDLYRQETQLLDLQVRGQRKKAEELERAMRIAQATKDIMDATGVSEEEALRLAKERVALEDKAARQNRSERPDGRQRIQGYKQEQGRVRDFQGLDGARFPGLDNRQRIQNRNQDAFTGSDRGAQRRDTTGSTRRAERSERAATTAGSTPRDVQPDIVRLLGSIDQRLSLY